MTVSLRLLTLALAACQLAAAWAPCPAQASSSPEAPRLERFCPCGCSAGPTEAPGGAASAMLRARPEAPRLPALHPEPPPAAPGLPAPPPRPIDHVPLPA